jgi:hypothetical protein
MKYGNRSLWKSIIASPVALIVVLVLFVVLANASWNIYGKARSSARRLDDVRLEFAKLEGRKNELAEKVAYLSTEQGFEAEIRTKFHAVRDGESVAVIIDESRTANANNASTVVASTSVGWWGRMLQAFGF